MAIVNSPETTRPKDNSGSRAQSRFLYQHHYTAFWCIQMLKNDQIEYLLCEHHEDLIVRWVDGHYTFIQVKTREEGQGEWTLADITAEDMPALQKLFAQKQLFGNGSEHKYIFASNMGVRHLSGKPSLKRWKALNRQKTDTWGAQEKQEFEDIFTEVKERFGRNGYSDEQSLRTFCAHLDFDLWQPNDKESLESFNHTHLRQVLRE